MKDWILIILITLGGIAAFAVGLVMIFAFYGAVFGGIAAGGYIAFKWLVGLAGL